MARIPSASRYAWGQQLISPAELAQLNMASRLTIPTMNGSRSSLSLSRLSFPGQRLATPIPTGTGVRPNSTTLGSLPGEFLDIGLDWLRSRLIPGNQPAMPSMPFAEPIPSEKCPRGQIGFPPACFDVQPGGDTQGGGMYIGYGEAVMGRYGAAIQPSVIPQQVRRCPRGAVLGNDGLCYNRKDLRRDERWWIPGRKPLLTGGDLNAITKANRAATKLRSKQKQLQKMGMLPKPTSRGRGRGQRHMLSAGSPVPGVQLISND